MLRSLTAPGLEDLAGRFLGWWAGELASLVPTGLIQWFAGRGRQLVIEVGDREARLIGEQEGARRTIVRAAPGDAEAMAALGERARTAARRHRTAIALHLPHEACLIRELELPAVPRERIAAMLAIDVARLLPDGAGDVVSAWSARRMRNRPRRLAVAHVIARRSSVEDGLAAVAACGIVPRTVDVALADGSAAGVDLKAALSEDGNRGRSRLGRFLLPLCILLAVAAPLGVILRNEQALAGLEARIAAAKQRAIAARAAEQQAAGASSAAALWLERRRTQPYATELWLEITRLLPDDVHAEELSIEGGTLSVDGMAGSAADLVPLLEGSPLLAEVTFASPVVLDPASGKERFSLRARIGAEAAP